MTPIPVDQAVAQLLLRYAKLIHVHHDETIALFASGAAKELRVLSLEFPYVTTLGRTVSEAYHRLNTLTSEVHFLAPDAVEWMYRHAESVIYPSRDATRRPAGGDRRA